jgi:hypothetical protein
MKGMSLILVLLVGFSFLFSGCSPEDDPDPTNGFSPIVADSISGPRALTGQVIGASSISYAYGDQKIVCADDAANYQMTVAKDGILPKDTNLTGKLPDKSNYFRLNISSVMRELQDFKCLIRDPSEDRILTPIEGSFDGSNYKFTAMTCGKVAKISTSDIYFTSDYVAKGEIVCSISDQAQYTFKFADLKLK